MMHQHEVVAVRDPGRLRTEQEDCCRAWVQGDAAVLIVADGMGGHAGGEIASRLAVETVAETLRAALPALQPPPEPGRPDAAESAGTATHKLPETRAHELDTEAADLLRRAVRAAHERVRAEAAARPEAAGDAGSTLTAALVLGQRVHIAHVGDSRAYLWHAPALRQLTHDHSGAAMLVAAGLLSAADARDHPESSTLYQYVGLPDKPLTVEIVHEPLEADDLLLLCTDGLWSMVTDGELVERIEHGTAPDELAGTLIAAANERGGKDNIAVALARSGRDTLDTRVG